MIDLDDMFDPMLYAKYPPQKQPHHHLHHPGQFTSFQPQHILEGTTTSLSGHQWQCSQIQIEELPSGEDETYLQPEVDQQQSLISEAAALLLSKPQSSTVYSLTEA